MVGNGAEEQSARLGYGGVWGGVAVWGGAGWGRAGCGLCGVFRWQFSPIFIV